MYEEFPVLSSMARNMLSSETLFPSTFQNPNFNFLPLEPFPPMIPKEENGLLLGGKEDMESGSGNEQQAEDKLGNEQNSSEQPLKKKRYHRHTAHQIQELEAESPHPDDKQRMRLNQELGLKPRQVKFWLNKIDPRLPYSENESLKNEFYLLQAKLSKLVCSNCDGPPVPGGVSFEELRIENARLEEEPMAPMLSEAASFPENNNLFLTEEEKTIAMELAMSSMDELVKMCRTNEPLWIRNNENGREMLNLEEHAKVFRWPLNVEQRSSEFWTEASRDSAVVIMNSMTLIDAFLDANKWTELFPSIVAKAKSVQVVSPGCSGANGCLQLIPSPEGIRQPSAAVNSAADHRLRWSENPQIHLKRRSKHPKTGSNLYFLKKTPNRSKSMKIPSVFSVLRRCLVLPAMVKASLLSDRSEEGLSVSHRTTSGDSPSSHGVDGWYSIFWGLRLGRGSGGGGEETVGSRVEAGAAPCGPRVSNPRVSLWSHLDRWIVPDPTVVMRRLMSSFHYELSAGDDDPSNDEFKQKIEQVLLIMNFFFLLQMTSSSHYELYLQC
ncbi:putative transcription factor [Hibiscus syriacus]|uniref:Transcription factor n=1 Tax=Hibiscus syriacus TaxID=106335 RepID=A0A6A3CLR4_HIBSY|nr:putative transcription factor [Hibiscus syriacus]